MTKDQIKNAIGNLPISEVEEVMEYCEVLIEEDEENTLAEEEDDEDDYDSELDDEDEDDFEEDEDDDDI